MIDHILRLPSQLTSRIAVEGKPPPRTPRGLTLIGTGGSGIAGEFLKAWLETSQFPIHLVQGFRLPPEAKIGPAAIAVSYSGATEETLSAALEARARGNLIGVVASGGPLLDLGTKEGLLQARLPPGLQPRAALGHSFRALCEMLVAAGVDVRLSALGRTARLLRSVRRLYDPGTPEGRNPAKQQARSLYRKTPVVYSEAGLAPAAHRWVHQLNENAKVLAWSGLLPQMNHNGIVGWTRDPLSQNYVAVFLREKKMEKAAQLRFQVTLNMIRTSTHAGEHVFDSESRLDNLFHAAYLGDFTSYYLALLRGVDPTPVEPIQKLKRTLRRRT